MESLPVSIKSYLQNLDSKCKLKAYLCLDKDKNLIACNGEIGDYNFSELDETKNIEQAVPFLEGLLPTAKKSNTVISNVHIDSKDYFDIHFIEDEHSSWVLFIDTTISANELQHEQQLRLDIDFINDKRKTGS